MTPFPLRHQPIKGLYLIYELLATTFFWIPIWFLISLPRHWRPRRSWTIKRCIWVNLTRHAANLMSRTGPFISTPNHFAICSGKGINGVWIEPVPHLVSETLEIWSRSAGVLPCRIPGYWIHKKGTTIAVAAPPMPGEKVILALHGGSYVYMSGYPNGMTANSVHAILEHCDTVHRVFSVEYRLSVALPFEPANPFPAALLDALAAYVYLVDTVGFSPADIIIEGESAGGNLAHAMTRYLVEHRNSSLSKLPAPPGALLLLSPWADIGISHDIPGTSYTTNRTSDIIGQKGGGFDYPHHAFLGPHGMGGAAINRYISPASLHPAMSISFDGFPRTFIAAGGAETLLDQILTLKTRMARDMGEGDGLRPGEGMVRYHEATDAVHAYLVFPWHEPERYETLMEISKWVDGRS